MPNKKKDPAGWRARRIAQAQKTRQKTLLTKKQLKLAMIDEDEEEEEDPRPITLPSESPPPLPALFSEPPPSPQVILHDEEPLVGHESRPNSVPVDNEIPLAMGSAEDHDESQLQLFIRELTVLLKKYNLRWGDAVEYISDPDNKEGTLRYHGFFKDKGRVRRVLTNWTSYKNPVAREQVNEWAISHISKMIVQEGNAATRDGFLQSRKRPVDESFALDFDLETLYSKVARLCPTMTALTRAFGTTARQKAKMGPERQAQKDKRIASVMITLLGERSQRNSYAKHVIGLYLYAAGAQRQVMSVCSSLGISSSYSTIAGTKRFKDEFSKTNNMHPSHLSDDDEPSDSDASDEELANGNEHERAEEDSRSRPSAKISTTSQQSDGVAATQDATVEEVEDEENEQATDSCSASAGLPRGTRGVGVLRRLSEASRQTARSVFKKTPCSTVYDNINWQNKVAEQVIGRKDAQENGTCASIFPLHGADQGDMNTDDLLKTYEQAPLLTLHDILLTPDERKLHRECMLHTLLRIVVNHGGAGFKKFEQDVRNSLPTTEDQIDVHKTDVYPLPAMDIDESSTSGNAEVVDAIYTELGLDLNSAEFFETCRIVNGDQLSIARLRGSSNDRIGHDSFRRSYLNLIPTNGLFHGQLHVAFGTLETHFGSSSSGPHNPGSLSHHNTVLDRKPIVLSSFPPYRTCRDLIFVSLYARVLHCLELVAEKPLEDYAQGLTFTQLREDIETLYNTYADSPTVDKLRAQRADSEAPDGTTTAGDMVFENAILFLRDALIMREFNDAIKSGDSGRVIVCLKNLALFYRGCGRTKYAYEMLVLIHHLTHIWPKPLRDIIIHNWVVNPTGRPNSFVPVDLLQEHMNFWIKAVYQAQGSNASWEWLAMVSPCINILRTLTEQINDTLGSKQGKKHHSPDLSFDIAELMKSLRRHGVYSKQPGRTFDDRKAVIPDVLVKGIQEIQKPLTEYNALFERLRRRRRIKPLILDGWQVPDTTEAGSNIEEVEQPVSIQAKGGNDLVDFEDGTEATLLHLTEDEDGELDGDATESSGEDDLPDSDFVSEDEFFGAMDDEDDETIVGSFLESMDDVDLLMD
ncbi:hypothetical protein NM688_g6203 [Phlebia brevispora]|uniref:Uncharacterized protein n=1 Tax=Phlebia brevispora TaxID=194682 RepID=A0ACC1SIS7_9APHY|nr:hypothetical protein NM688_g6203 [Phlebia brevispora]